MTRPTCCALCGTPLAEPVMAVPAPTLAQCGRCGFVTFMVRSAVAAVM